MSDDRLFERNARAWLEVGPTTAPKRVVDSALLAIETTPQQRGLRAPWGFPRMTIQTRFAVAAAVGLLAVGAGLLILRSPQSQVGRPSPSPTTSPSSSPISLEELRGTWASVGTRSDPLGDNANPPHEDYETIAVDAAGLRIAGYKEVISSASIAGAAGQLTLRLEAPEAMLSYLWDCATGDTGTYHASLSADGQTLTLTSDSDECTTRGEILAGSWTRWSCGANYLGYAYCPHLNEQVPGSRVSSVFKPFGGGTSGRFAWTAAGTGWVTLATPPTWPERDTPSAAWLYRPGAPNSGYSVINAVGVFSDLVPSPARAIPIGSAPTATCSDSLPATPGTAAEIADRLESLPYLAVSNRTQVTIGGLRGVQLDVSLVGGFVDPCSTTSSPEGGDEYEQAIQIFDDLADPSAAIYLSPADVNHAPSTGPSARLIVLDTGDANRHLVIEIPAPADNSTLEALIAQAMPVIESFEFIP